MFATSRMAPEWQINSLERDCKRDNLVDALSSEAARGLFIIQTRCKMWIHILSELQFKDVCLI